VVFRTLAYREAWGLGPRQSLAMLTFLARTRPIWRGNEAEMNLYSPPVGSPAYGRYLRGLRQMARGRWVPLVAHLSVTDRCPYRCRRCSNVSGGAEDPPLERLARLADELRADGTCRVALTGGEPLLRDDLPAIVEACGRELSPVLFTSGHGLDAPRARQLAHAGLAAAYVSLDHFRAEEHDVLRGQPGAMERAVAALRACREAGLFTAAQCVIGPSLLMAGEFERFLAFCEGLGVHEVMLLEPVAIGSCPADTSDAEALRERLGAVHLRASGDATLPKVSSMSWLENPECLGCQAGFSFLYVSTRGEVFPCDFVPASFGNVYELGLREIHGRMTRLLKHPSSVCLARELFWVYGKERGWPLPWEETQAVFSDYQPGPVPKLMRCFCHANEHVA
jgi:MoaA/NifB/PqqE/SkfB family radical SAM enzyme